MHGRSPVRWWTFTVLVAAGCISSTEPARVVTLQVDLVPAEGALDPVSGSVALVITESLTQVGISVQGGEDGARLGWALRDGRCGAAGLRIGPASTYPAIVVATGGTGSAEARLFRRIPDDVLYAVEVFRAEDGSGEVLACADLDPRD